MKMVQLQISKQKGENISFNKQAEIAMYLISEKFTKPALQKEML